MTAHRIAVSRSCVKHAFVFILTYICRGTQWRIWFSVSPNSSIAFSVGNIREIRMYHVMQVTDPRLRTCDTHVVDMDRKASKQAFLEPGDTK